MMTQAQKLFLRKPVRAGERAAGSNGLVREVLKAADMLQAEGLLKHCLEAFGGGLTVHTAIEHLVWAHKQGPEEARGLAMAYVVQHIKTIQVTEPSQAACRACAGFLPRAMLCMLRPLMFDTRPVCAVGGFVTEYGSWSEYHSSRDHVPDSY